MRKVLLAFLSLLVATGMTPLTAFALESDNAADADNTLLAQAETKDRFIPMSGWKKNGTTLTISGNGMVGVGPLSTAERWSIETLIIEEGVTGIADTSPGVFQSFKHLKSISLPSTLKKIGDNAFREAGMSSFVIPDSVTTIGSQAFSKCENLRNIEFGAGIETIGDYVFSSCPSLESVEFNEGLQTIGEGAFYSCEGLKEVRFGTGLKTIGESAFSSCPSLESVEFNEGLQTIETRAFNSCKNLKEVKFGTGLKTIGDSAFLSCSGLESVEFNEGLQTIGEKAFVGTALAKVSIPSTVQNIGNSAFADLSGLESIALLGNTAIGESSFADCSALKSVDISNARALGERAFENCNELSTVKMEKIETIDDCSFSGCVKLESVVFPATLTSLGSDVFKGCSDQMMVEFLGDAPSSCRADAVRTAEKIIYPSRNATWTDDAKKTIGGSGVNKLYMRNADGTLTKEPYLCVWETTYVPFGSAKSEWLRESSASNLDHRCFDFTIPKDMKARVFMTYMLPCYHGSYAVTLRDSAGEEIYSDIAMRSSNTGDMVYDGEYAIERDFKAGDYHLEVWYVQTHKGKDGMFTVGVYDAIPDNPKPNDPGTTDPEPVGTQAMYRLYNPNSGEHFYTASTIERDAVIAAGWNDEGVGWTAPTSGIQVYRLYNSFAGEHHYTTSAEERDMLVSVGWTWEEGGWFSDEAESVPLYRAYNPNAFANNHHYTTDWGEFQTLLSLGWQDEGVGWHGVN